MSAEELRNLVAQLQEDLMETTKQKEEGQGQIQRLQHKLEATENTVRHISRKLKSSQPGPTTECFSNQNPATRRSQSETSIHRGDHWSRICQGMLNDGPMGGDGHSNGLPFNNFQEYGPTNHAALNARTKSWTGFEHVKKQTPPPPKLQRVRTLSSSCILSSNTNHLGNEAQSTSSVHPTKSNYNTKKTPTHGSKLSNDTDMSSQANSDVNSNLNMNYGSKLVTTPPQTQRNNRGTFQCQHSNNDNDDNIPNSNQNINSNSSGKRNQGSAFENDKTTHSISSQHRNVQQSPKELATKQSNLPQQHHGNFPKPNLQDTQSQQWIMDGDDACRKAPCFYSPRSNPAFGISQFEPGSGKVESISSKGFNYSSQLGSKPETEILNQLQHLLGEKEEMWKNKTMEIKHRMKKENFLLMQENELLNEEVKLLRENVDGKEKTINELKEENYLKDKERKRLVDEIKTLKREKATIETDLINQDRELIDMDQTLCKLEITKKESDVQKRKKSDELEENKRELSILKKELEQYKETSKLLKESLIKREASLQEQIFTVRKLRAERDNEERQSTISRTPDIIKTEKDFQRTRSLNEKHPGTNSCCDGPKIVYKRENQHELFQHITNLKEDLKVSREEIIKLKAEKDRINTNFNLQISDMEKQVADKVDLENRLSQAEFELKSKKGLDDEIVNLRSQLDKKLKHEIKMRSRVAESESAVSRERTQFLISQRELKEKTDRIHKRDKQCQELCEKFGKLDAAYIKQTKLLREKTDIIDHLKKRLRDYEFSTASKYLHSYNDDRTLGSKL